MYLEAMHKTLKYCTFEKKKIRRLDHALHLVTKLFSDINNDYQLKLRKPRSNGKTTLIFQNHKKSQEEGKKGIWKVEKINDSTNLIVKDSKNQYKISLEEPSAHECHLACVWCGFCVHTFHCSCQENCSKGSFCIHLHMLSTKPELLPHFEKPINRHFVFFENFVRSSSERLIKNIANTIPTSKPTNQSCLADKSQNLQQDSPLTKEIDTELAISTNDSSATGNILAEESQYLSINFNIPDDDIPDYGLDQDEENRTDVPTILPDQDENEVPESNEEDVEKRRLALQNVRRLLSTYNTHLTAFENSLSNQDNHLPLNELYDYLNKGLPIVSRLSGAKTFESRKSQSTKKKTTAVDKQKRLHAKPKDQKKGRPTKKRVLKMPNTPEKLQLKETLLKNPAIKRKLELKTPQKRRKNK